MPGHRHRRKYHRHILTTLLTLVLVLAAAAHPSAAGQDKVPLSVIHPALEQLMERDPNRRVPVIIQKAFKGAKNHEIAQVAGAPVDEEYTFIDSFRITVPARSLRGLAQARGVRYISPDGPVALGSIDTSQLQPAYPQVTGAASLWNTGTGLTGRGVTVAVIDSGVATHPDFGNRILTRWAAKSANVNDLNGHGTHVAGTIAGRSADGKYIGVAPESNIISLKTTNDTNNTSEAAVVKALQWVYDNRSTYNIRIVNMSISAQTPNSYLFSPMAAAAERLWQVGIVVVAAAGNRGSGLGTMWYPPGNDPFLITVGAIDDNQTVLAGDDSIAPFSSFGATQNRFSKPDLVAPGRRIVAPLASASAALASSLPERVTADGKYIRLSGTSMATPVVSGLIALMLERYPELTPNQVKWVLTATTLSYSGQPTGSAGMVNLQGALDLVAQRKSAGLALGEANTNGLIPNPQLNLLTTNASWETTNWQQATSTMYETTAYWDTAYWDTAYWDTAYWDTAYWDTAYWETYYSETAYWDDTNAMTFD